MSEGFKTKSAQAKKSDRHQRKPKEVASIGAIQQSLVEHFEDIKDPRIERTRETSTHRHSGNCDSGSHSRSARVGRHRELRHQQATVVTHCPLKIWQPYYHA
jgi:hypothetical protein